jgi:hypothetical protein
MAAVTSTSAAPVSLPAATNPNNGAALNGLSSQSNREEGRGSSKTEQILSDASKLPASSGSGSGSGGGSKTLRSATKGVLKALSLGSSSSKSSSGTSTASTSIFSKSSNPFSSSSKTIFSGFVGGVGGSSLGSTTNSASTTAPDIVSTSSLVPDSSPLQDTTNSVSNAETKKIGLQQAVTPQPSHGSRLERTESSDSLVSVSTTKTDTTAFHSLRPSGEAPSGSTLRQMRIQLESSVHQDEDFGGDVFHYINGLIFAVSQYRIFLENSFVQTTEDIKESLEEANLSLAHTGKALLCSSSLKILSDEVPISFSKYLI